MVLFLFLDFQRLVKDPPSLSKQRPQPLVWLVATSRMKRENTSRILVAFGNKKLRARSSQSCVFSKTFKSELMTEYIEIYFCFPFSIIESMSQIYFPSCAVVRKA